MNLGDGDTLLAIARNADEDVVDEADDGTEAGEATRPGRARGKEQLGEFTERAGRDRDPAASGTGNGAGSTPADRSGSGARSTSTSGPWLSDASATRATESVDAPPWQRAAGRGQQSGPRPPLETTARIEPRPAAPPAPAAATSSSAPTTVTPAVPPDSRVNRYITGTAAPAAFQSPKPEAPEPEPTVARTEVARSTEYASELPDLSGPVPRSAAAAHRDGSGGAGRVDRRPGPAAASRWRARSKGGPVRASMQIRRIDPWSALKVSLLLSVALFFVWMIAVAFLYLVLGGMGVWSKLNSNVGDLLTNTSGGGGELVSAGTIFGGALLIGLVNIVLLTAMATIGAFVYNLTHRHRRRRRGHARRPRLTEVRTRLLVWERGHRCGNLAARPCASTGL